MWLDLGFALPLATLLPAAQAQEEGPQVVEGRVVRDDGSPCSGFSIAIADVLDESPWQVCPAAETDGEGRFCIDVPRSAWLGVAFGVGPDGRSRVRPATVHSDAARVDLGTLGAETVETWLTGSVVAESGDPVAGAAVGAFGLGGTFQTTSDSAGRFVVRGVAAGETAWVQARHGAHVSRTLLVDSGSASDQVRLELQHSRTIHGIVKSRDGELLSGARVSAATIDSTSRTVTSDRGEFTLDPVVSGRATVTITAAGFQEQLRVMDVDSGDLVVAELSPAIEIRGRARLFDGVTPVQVTKVDYDGDAPVNSVRLTSAADGSFRLQVAAADAGTGDVPLLSLWLFAAGLAPTRIAVPLRMYAVYERSLAFISGRELQIEVFDFEGRAVPGASLTVDLPSSLTAGPFATVVTGSDGRARFANLTWETLRLAVNAANHPSVQIDRIEDSRSERDPIRVTLPRAGFIEGSITLGGDLAEDFEKFGSDHLLIRPACLRVDSMGRFRSKPLAPGNYTDIEICCSDLIDCFEVWLDGEKIADPEDSWRAVIPLAAGQTRQLELRIVK